jgi:hypothetical protein
MPDSIADRQGTIKDLRLKSLATPVLIAQYQQVFYCSGLPTLWHFRFSMYKRATPANVWPSHPVIYFDTTAEVAIWTTGG